MSVNNLCQWCGKGTYQKTSGAFLKCSYCGEEVIGILDIRHTRARLRRELIVAGFGGWWANSSDESSSSAVIETADKLLVKLLGPELEDNDEA